MSETPLTFLSLNPQECVMRVNGVETAQATVPVQWIAGM